MRDVEDVLTHFTIRVNAERERYQRKFASLRDDPSCAGLSDLIDAVEKQVNAIADGEIARAKAAGKVEFDTTATAIRTAASALGAAVGKLEKE
jgi:hypothetical protein